MANTAGVVIASKISRVSLSGSYCAKTRLCSVKNYLFKKKVVGFLYILMSRKEGKVLNKF